MKSKQEILDSLKGPLCICDSTLESGEQAAGTVFSSIEKYRIAQLLDDAGVPQIEAGSPMLGADEKKIVKHIAHMGLDASIMSYNRAEPDDVNASIDCDVDAVTIALPASDILIEKEIGQEKSWVLDKVYEAAELAVAHGLYTCVMAEDASRADLGYLIDFAKVAKDVGADRFGYCDTYGLDNPFDCQEKIKMIRQIAGVEVEIIAHNDFGLANANVMGAVKGGARFARVTSMGLGPRAGCASLEQVAMSAKHMLGIDTGIDTTRFPAIAESVSKASGIAIDPLKPFIGSKCFALEQGILNDPGCTEPYDPKEVGGERTFVIGKHSVRNTIIAEMSGMSEDGSISLSRAEADQLLAMVRRASVMMHRSLTGSELFLLYEDMMSGNNVFDDGEEPEAESPAADVPEYQ